MKRHVVLTKKGALALVDRRAGLVSGKERALLVTLYRSPEYKETLRRLEGWPLGIELLQSLLRKGLIQIGEPELMRWVPTHEIDFTLDCVITRLSEGMSEEEAVVVIREAIESGGFYFFTGVPYPPGDFRAVLTRLVSMERPFVSMLASSMLMQLTTVTAA
jgi:hypothetical protein